MQKLIPMIIALAIANCHVLAADGIGDRLATYEGELVHTTFHVQYTGVYYNNPATPYSHQTESISAVSRFKGSSDTLDYYYIPVAGAVQFGTNESNAKSFVAKKLDPMYLLSRNVVTQEVTTSGHSPILSYANSLMETPASNAIPARWSVMLSAPSDQSFRNTFSTDVKFDYVRESRRIAGQDALWLQYDSQTFTQTTSVGARISGRIHARIITDPTMRDVHCLATLFQGTVEYQNQTAPLYLVNIESELVREDGENTVFFDEPDFQQFVGRLEQIRQDMPDIDTMPAMPAWIGEAVTAIASRNAGASIAVENRTNFAFLALINIALTANDIIALTTDLFGSEFNPLKEAMVVIAGTQGLSRTDGEHLYNATNMFLSMFSLTKTVRNLTSLPQIIKEIKNAASQIKISLRTIPELSINIDATLDVITTFISQIWQLANNALDVYGYVDALMSFGDTNKRLLEEEQIRAEARKYQEELAKAKAEMDSYATGLGEWGRLARSYRDSGVVPGAMPRGYRTPDYVLDNLAKTTSTPIYYKGHHISKTSQGNQTPIVRGGLASMSIDFSDRSFTGGINLPEVKVSQDFTWYGFDLTMAWRLLDGSLVVTITNYTNTSENITGVPASSNVNGFVYGPGAEGVGGSYSFSPGQGMTVGSFGLAKQK